MNERIEAYAKTTNTFLPITFRVDITIEITRKLITLGTINKFLNTDRHKTWRISQSDIVHYKSGFNIKQW